MQQSCSYVLLRACNFKESAGILRKHFIWDEIQAFMKSYLFSSSPKLVLEKTCMKYLVPLIQKCNVFLFDHIDGENFQTCSRSEPIQYFMMNSSDSCFPLSTTLFAAIYPLLNFVYSCSADAKAI